MNPQTFVYLNPVLKVLLALGAGLAICALL